jgi:hypothetical protein
VTGASLAAVLALALALLGAPAAEAAVPSAKKIRRAAARTNKAAGRTRTLLLEVELRFEGADEVSASGVLLSEPGGLARLELRSPTGFTERHLHRGGRTLASRDGVAVPDPRPLLPPFHLLQARSSDVLGTGIAALGARSDVVSLGHVGASDCYVLGGRAGPAASVWVDAESREIVRVLRSDGVRFDFGPLPAQPEETEQARIRVPAWVDIHQPGARPARLSIGSVTAVEAQPDSFRPGWLEFP